jgi:monoamine oxidase
VTLPLALLQAQPDDHGAVRFTPPLPRTKLEALKRLEMGKVIRVTFRFHKRFWDSIPAPNNREKTLSGMGFLFSDDEWLPTWWTTMPHKLPMITARAPFRCAKQLSGESRSFVIDSCLQTLSRLLSVELEELTRLLDDAYFHDWQNDPFSRGTYCYGGLGADGAQQALANPIENTLFFAGEATDITGHNAPCTARLRAGIARPRRSSLISLSEQCYEPR